MKDITPYTDSISKAVYGKDVRSAIVSALTANGENVKEAVNKASDSASAAKSSETAAAESASAAKTSETAAAGSEKSAADSATSAKQSAMDAAGYAGAALYSIGINPETGHMAIFYNKENN
ncbi:MAG: hypothetical protein J6M57_10225 [Acidaminococcaceae bacterium]|nr:hypothetical protein [Acidaminococcaceae bacterium]